MSHEVNDTPTCVPTDLKLQATSELNLFLGDHLLQEPAARFYLLHGDGANEDVLESKQGLLTELCVFALLQTTFPKLREGENVGQLQESRAKSQALFITERRESL